MKRLALILGCLLSASLCHATYSGYTYQRIFSILHAKVPNTDQVNFPVLISTTDATLATVANGGHLQNSSGFDLVFSTMSDCSFLANWDTEIYNASTGNVIVWVKHPKVLTASDTTLYMCYGNSGITTYQGVSASAWDSNYKGVWHFPNGSTLTGVNAVTNVAATLGSAVTAAVGQIDGGAQNAGGSTANDKITTDLTSNSNLRTYSLWVKRDSTGGNLGRYFSKGPSAEVDWLFWNTTPSVTYQRAWTTGGQWSCPAPSNDALHYIVVTYDSSAAGNAPLMYVDGVSKTVTLATGATGSRTDNAGAFVIGNRGTDNARPMKGIHDEFRISDSIRSADWIATEYNNQSSISTFMTMGPETQTVGAASGNAFWFGGM